MARPKTKSRQFRGFAVLERPGGALVWGTFRPSAAEARKLWEQWNPPLEGFTPAAQIVAVEVSIFDTNDEKQL